MALIEENAERVLAFLATKRGQYVKGVELAKALSLEPDAVNDAVALLVDRKLAEWERTFGSEPFEFGYVKVTARGRFESERAAADAANSAQAPRAVVLRRGTTRQKRQTNGKRSRLAGRMRPRITLRPTPEGSPFGFTEVDWEVFESRKADVNTLHVVLGLQFRSKNYRTPQLRKNVERMFADALATHNESARVHRAKLEFRSLAAGYGGHLFNKIARDIISADIAVFETSDQNANVMMEMGIALTWGVRVLPIKKLGSPRLPSDISGLTWAEYRNSAATFVDADWHETELLDMVRRAVGKKSRG